MNAQIARKRVKAVMAHGKVKARSLWASLLLMLAFMPGAAFAQAGWSCWVEASQEYGVPMYLLYAVARVESGMNPHLVHHNRDGSDDIGLVQINSTWLGDRRLASRGITRTALLNYPCINLKTGAWVMANCLKKHGLNWRGIGCYNAASPDRQIVYARLIIRELARIRSEGYGST